MKKKLLFLILFIFTLSLYAAVEVDPITNGFLFFENEEYQNAYDILIGVEDKNVDIMIILGESCEKLGKYEEALYWFNEVEKKDSKNFRAGINMLKLYLYLPLKNTKKADEKYKQMYKNASESEKKILDSIMKPKDTNKISKNSFEGNAVIKYIYDDNINFEKNDKKRDSIINTNINLGYIILDSEKIFIEPILIIDYNMYLKYKEKNKLNINYLNFNKIQYNNINISFPFGAGVAISDKKVESFQYNFSLSSDLEINKSNFVSPFLNFININNYKNDLKSTNINLGVKYLKDMELNKINTTLNLGKNISNKQEDNFTVGLEVGYNREINKENNIGVKYNINSISYSEIKDRKDLEHKINVIYNIEIFKINFMPEYELTINKSNQNVYDYQENKISFEIKKGF